MYDIKRDFRDTGNQFASSGSLLKFLRYARVNERRFYDQSIGNSWITAAYKFGAVIRRPVQSINAGRKRATKEVYR